MINSWGRRSVAGILVGAAALLVAAAAWASYSGPAAITHFNGNIVSCTSLGYAANGTFANNGASGTYSTDHAASASPLTVQVTNQGGKPMTFDWQSLNLPVLAVIVTVGNGGTIYTYPGGATSDTGLESLDSNGGAKDSISHLVFCVGSAHTTAVTLRSFDAKATSKGVLLRWSMATGTRTLGFNIYRQTGTTKVRVNSKLILTAGAATAAGYSYLDRRSPGGRAVRYHLQEVETSGASRWLARTNSSS